MRVVARDPETQRDSPEEERTIVVVTEVAGSPSAAPATLAVTSPAVDARVSGPIPIAGTAQPSGTVVVTATLTAAAAPTFAITDAAGTPVTITPQPPAPPEALTLTADAGGAFTGSLALAPGTWQVTFTPEAGEAVVRSVVVAPAAELTARLDIGGADSWLELAADGEPVEGYAGGLAEAGETIELSAQEELRVRSGNAAAVTVTVDGIPLGAMGANGAVVEWQVTRTGG
jgi:hypothetical protein